MRFSKVLLIQPQYVGSFYRPGYFSSGIAYISMALIHANIENKFLDMNLGYDYDALHNCIKEFKPDLIGIGMMSFRAKHTYDFIEKIKKDFPEISIILGGPHVSVFGKKVLEDCSYVDYGVTKEGEEIIVELCRGETPVNEIKGMYYRTKKEIVFTGERPYIKDLNKNGFPRYERFELNRYPAHARPLVTSRGCPYKCTFCSVNLAIGPQFRVRDAQSVVEEIEFWYHKGVRRFSVVDDCFTLRRERVFQICDEIEKRQLTGLEIDLANGIRADRVDREMLARMKEVGFSLLAFGVEGGNNKVLKRLRKGETIETIEKAIATACDLEFQVVLFFVIGSPEETPEDVKDSVRIATKYPVYNVAFNSLTPFAGTELYEWVEDNQFFTDGIDYLQDITQRINSPVFETPEMSSKQRMKLYRWANRKAALHTLAAKQRVHSPQSIKQLESYGVPVFIAKILLRIYWSKAFHICVRQTGFLLSIRNIILENYQRMKSIKEKGKVIDRVVPAEAKRVSG